MDTCSYVGNRVRIETEDGKYEGYIHSVDFNNSKLSLDRVMVCGSGKRLQGLQHFYGKELESLEMLEDTSSPRKAEKKATQQKRSGCQMESSRRKELMQQVVRKPTQRGCKTARENGQGLMEKGAKYTPPHLKNLRDVDLSKLCLSGQSKASSGEEEEIPSTEPRGSPQSGYDSGIDHEGSQKRKFKFSYSLIDKLEDQSFNDALEYISNHMIIGLAVEGINMGRNGKLCWIQISSPDHVFLFDIISLGAESFKQGLKHILENENHLKVMHDCRLPSDILWHQYQIKLVNIFDTQVADVFVYRNSHGGDWPRYVQGLPIILMEYLALVPHDVHIMRVRKRCTQEDEAVWSERPAKENVLEDMVKDVVYLRQLRKVLVEKMLSEYTAGVDLYLTYARTASKNESHSIKESSHLLPVAFKQLSEEVYLPSYQSKRYREMSGKKLEKDTHGFLENYTRVIDPAITYTRESIIHAARRTDTVTGTHSSGHVGMDKEEKVMMPQKSAEEDRGWPGIMASEGTEMKPNMGRGSSLVPSSLRLIPGIGLNDPLDSAGNAASKWKDLMESRGSKLDSYVLRPAGVQEPKLGKQGRDPPSSSEWVPMPFLEQLSSNNSWDMPEDHGSAAQTAKMTNDNSPAASASFDPELEQDCFDLIPSRKHVTVGECPKESDITSFGTCDSSDSERKAAQAEVKRLSSSIVKNFDKIAYAKLHRSDNESDTSSISSASSKRKNARSVDVLKRITANMNKCKSVMDVRSAHLNSLVGDVNADTASIVSIVTATSGPTASTCSTITSIATSSRKSSISSVHSSASSVQSAATRTDNASAVEVNSAVPRSTPSPVSQPPSSSPNALSSAIKKPPLSRLQLLLEIVNAKEKPQ